MRCQVLFFSVSYFSPLRFHDLHFTATSRKTGITGDKGLKISMGGGEFRVALQGCEENEAQGFTQLDDRSKVVSIDEAISPSEIAPAKQSKKRQI